jgi:dTDP-4-dehydro-6-deoxy-alpha-D-gulose 4-ketoreductase
MLEKNKLINYWGAKKILITGANGFLGSHFLEELNLISKCVVGTSLNASKNDNIINLDLSNKSELLKLCDKYDFNTLIHCAAIDGNAEFKNTNLVRVMDENMILASNVLAASRETGIENVVLISSAEVYSSASPSPILEEFDYRNNFNHIGNGYVLAKIFSEMLAQLYSKQYGMNIFLPRPTNIYGPRDNFSEGVSKVIPSMIRSALSNAEINVWGDGSQIRDFIYVKNLVHIIMNMVFYGHFGVVNATVGQQTSIRNLAEIITRMTKSKSKIKYLTDKPAGANQRVLDTGKVSSLIDFKPTSLDIGLSKTIHWYENRF